MPGAAAALAKVEAELDGYATRWAESSVENCTATRIRHQQSEALLDQRGRCLASRLDQLDALVEVLTRADGETVEQAVMAVESLPSLRRCTAEQVAEAGALLPDDPTLAAQVSEARRQLAGVRASLDTGRYAEAGERLDAIEPDIVTLDYPPLTAELAIERGRQHGRSDRYAEAAASLQQGYFLATELGDHEQAVRAALWLAELEGAVRQRPEFADLWAAQTAALLARAPGRHPELAADLADTTSWNAYLRGDLAAAKREAEQGLATLDEAGLAAPMRRVALLLDRGAAEYGAGELEAAETSFEAALELATATVGRDNPKATGALNNLAITYLAEGEHERARALLEESVAVREKALGPDNASVASGLSNLADVELELGHGEAALAAAERADRILTATLGPDQFATVIARQRHGLALALVGRPEAALVELEGARTTAQAPPPDPSLGVELTAQIAAVAAVVGDVERATAELEAVELSSPELWAELVNAGRYATTLAESDPERRASVEPVAAALLERAIELAGDPTDPNDRRRRALAKLALARLWSASDPAKAAALLGPELDDDLRSAPAFAAELERLRERLR